MIEWLSRGSAFWGDSPKILRRCVGLGFCLRPWLLFNEQGQALLDLRSWGPTTGEARCGLLGHLLADQSHSLGALPIRDVGYQDVIVTGGTAGVASKQASARRPKSPRQVGREENRVGKFADGARWCGVEFVSAQAELRLVVVVVDPFFSEFVSIVT